MRFRSFLAGLIAVLICGAAFAESPREQADKRDVKRQDFLKRLPLESRCKAEVAGGVLKPPGSEKWVAGSFEVEPQDDFRVRISKIEQLPIQERATCEAQARLIEYDDVKRSREFEDGHLLCMERVYNDKGRLPQLTACRLSTLLTQPLHLRCRNLDPILDPDGMFVAPNLLTVVTLPQAAMTKGTCQAADRS